MACYAHLLDMPGCPDCERNDPHILRARLQATEAEVARLRAALNEEIRTGVDLIAENTQLRAAVARALDDLGRRDELSAIDGLSEAIAE